MCLGVRRTFRRLAPHVGDLGDALVIDVGGGTGLYASALPSSAKYMCLDMSANRLMRARRVTPRVVRCDAAQLPLTTRSADCALCIGVAHHLGDTAFERLIAEIRRVVRLRFIFLEPLRGTESVLSRLLWSLDAGSHPRLEETLLRALSGAFTPIHIERYTIYHQYLLFVGTPKPV